MARAGPDALKRLQDCLVVLRTMDGIVERKPGIFYRKSEAFLHFHEDGAILCADIRLVRHAGFTRMPATSRAERNRLLAAAAKALKT